MVIDILKIKSCFYKGFEKFINLFEYESSQLIDLIKK